MRVVPKQIIRLVKEHCVLFSGKAQDELDAGIFDTDEVIHSIMRGKVTKKEKDELKESQYKYTIVGPSYSGKPIYSCGKVIKLLRKAYFIITFHEEG